MSVSELQMACAAALSGGPQSGVLRSPLPPYKSRVCGRSWQKVCHLHTQTGITVPESITPSLRAAWGL